MSPRRVLKEHTSREITEWMAYLSDNPQGETRADLRAGIITAGIVNAVVGVAPLKRRPKPRKPSDYMPFTKKRSGKMTDADAAVNWLKAVYPGK
jgi:hypothetical protein